MKAIIEVEMDNAAFEEDADRWRNDYISINQLPE